MGHLQVVIYEVDDEHSEERRELSRFDIPEVDPEAVSPETTLDELEASTQEIGNAILRAVLVHRREALDGRLAESYRRHFSP